MTSPTSAEKPFEEKALGQDPYQCGECQRYYGDSQSLKIHMKKHEPAGEEGDSSPVVSATIASPLLAFREAPGHQG